MCARRRATRQEGGARVDQYMAGRRHNATQTQAREQTTGGGQVRRTTQQSMQEGGGREMQICLCAKARATKRGMRARINSRRQQSIFPMHANSSTKRDNQQR